MENRKVIDDILNFKAPLLSRIWVRFWFWGGKYIFIFAWIVVFILIIITNSFIPEYDFYTREILWTVMKTIVLSTIGFFGLVGAISHIWKEFSIRRKAKKIGISIEEWNRIIEKHEIKI